MSDRGPVKQAVAFDGFRLVLKRYDEAAIATVAADHRTDPYANTQNFRASVDGDQTVDRQTRAKVLGDHCPHVFETLGLEIGECVASGRCRLRQIEQCSRGSVETEQARSTREYQDRARSVTENESSVDSAHPAIPNCKDTGNGQKEETSDRQEDRRNVRRDIGCSRLSDTQQSRSLATCQEIGGLADVGAVEERIVADRIGVGTEKLKPIVVECYSVRRKEQDERVLLQKSDRRSRERILERQRRLRFIGSRDGWTRILRTQKGGSEYTIHTNKKGKTTPRLRRRRCLTLSASQPYGRDATFLPKVEENGVLCTESILMYLG